MKHLISAVLAVALAAGPTATAASAGDSHHNGGWNGGHYHSGSWRWSGSSWVWGAPLLGAAIAGSILAAPYAFGGYVYPTYYSYPTPLVPPQPRWCQGYYGVYQC